MDFKILRAFGGFDFFAGHGVWRDNFHQPRSMSHANVNVSELFAEYDPRLCKIHRVPSLVSEIARDVVRQAAFLLVLSVEPW